jgi:large subunit ribosomal protein L18e
MLRSIRKENPELRHVLLELRRAAKAHDAPIWQSVAERLARPRHQILPINVGNIERIVAAQETVVVPGKLLAEGAVSKPVTVAAFQYSKGARAKIQTAGGKVLTIHELLRARPNGSGVRIIG